MGERTAGDQRATHKATPKERYLSPGHPRFEENRCELLRDGTQAFPKMLRAIEGARSRVCLETYMFLDDEVGRRFAEVLSRAAQRGVKVTVLYDWLGSLGSRGAFFEGLRARGVDARPFRPLALRFLGRLSKRDHRKLLVVDGEVAFIGGINIASHWAPKGRGSTWRDDVLEVEGPAVSALERRFFAVWRLVRKTRGPKIFRRRQKRRGDASLVVLSSRKAIHGAYLRAIGAAQRSVRIAAAYFVPDRKLISALTDASRRGVRVVLLMAGRSDHPWVTWASRALYASLLAEGVRIYEWNNGVLHAKTAVVDGTWGTVGSFNLERCSLRLNHEVNVFFEDPGLGKRLESTLGGDLSCCAPIEPASWARRPLWQRLLEQLAHFAYRALHLPIAA